MNVKCPNCGSDAVWKCEATDTARVFESDDNGETVEKNEVTAVFYECDDCGARWTT